MLPGLSFIVILFLLLFSLPAHSAIIPVNCNSGSLQAAIEGAAAGDIIQVTGTCNENILVRNEKQRITIDGAGAGVGTRATINGSAGSPAFNVRGKGILIQNFAITGGSDGINVNRGSNAVIHNNLIQNTNGSGVVVQDLAFAVITLNTITNNPGDGVVIHETSTARIGFNSDSDVSSSPNTIQGNLGRGITIGNSSGARIVGNNITGNGLDGIGILRDSNAELSGNNISGNSADGVLVSENSNLRLVESPEGGIFISANSTVEGSLNGAFGLRCQSGSVVDGVLGTLNGSSGVSNLLTSCISGTLDQSPIAVADNTSTGTNSQAIFSVLGNDSDPDNDPLTVTSFTQGINGTVSCTLSGLCTYTPNSNFSGVDTFNYTISDGKGGFTTTSATVTVTPPDPSVNAPQIDRSVATTIGKATEFLYTGSNPLQTGVAPGTIQPIRAAVLRGRVLTREGNVLPGATVSVLNNSQFGQTVSRSNGFYDLAVNGGGPLTINYTRSGYLPAQRQVNVPWQDYVNVPDVALIPLDTRVTTITPNASTMQVHQSNMSTDGDGSRKATLLFPAGTSAQMVMQNGTTQPLTNLNVRATEYTVGTSGPMAMPAELPPTSGYTYAVEFSVDQAMAAEANQVIFNQPLPVYVDNFLNFPVGIEVPLGYYDRQKSAWVASDNGRIVQIVSISGGLANVDTDGNGTADNGLGITLAERQQLANLYASGKTLWRMPIPHFSPWDSNWPYGPPPDADPPGGPPPDDGDNPPDDPDECEGSIIGCQGQVLGEKIRITGTPYSLNYRSDRVLGRSAARSINVPLSGASLPASVKSIELEVNVAGQKSVQTFGATTNQTTTFLWDGKDALGRDLQGRQKATVRVGYTYDGVYQRTERFGYNGNGVPITGSKTRQEVTLNRITESIIGPWDARQQGLGGWSFDVHHAYDPNGKILYQGNGTRRSVQTINAAISTIAGNGVQGFSGDSGQATQAAFQFPQGVATAPDGTLYIADTANRRVRRIVSGIVTTVVGTGALCSPTTNPCGDGGLATAAQLHSPESVAFGPDGSLYIADPGAKKIRRVAPNGTISTVAGTGAGCVSTTAACGDGGPATAATLGFDPNGPQHLAVTPDGTLYITDGAIRRVRRIGTDGIITTVAGSGVAPSGGCSNDGVVALAACLGFPWGIAAAPDGSIYFSDSQLNQIFRLGVSGLLARVAGSAGVCGSSGDGGPASGALLCTPLAVAQTKDGSLYVADLGNSRIRKIGNDGVITTIAGNGTAGFSGDSGPAAAGQIRNPIGVGVGVDGAIYIADGNNHRIRKVTAPLPGFTDTEIVIPSADANTLYQFNSEGRHLSTVHSLTGATIMTFAYDGAGRLATIIDGDNNVTSVQRNGSGNITGVTGPFGQVTTLALDGNGYLASIANPAGESHVVTYSADGLMLSFKDPKNQTAQITYDGLGRLNVDTDAAGGSHTLVRSDIAGGYEVARTTGLGRLTNYKVEQFSNGNRQRNNTLPDGLNAGFTEGASGAQSISFPDGTVGSATQKPDPRFAMQAPVVGSESVNTPGGLAYAIATTRTASLSNPNNPLSLISQTETTNINGRVYSATFNAGTKTTTMTSPQGRAQSLVVDSLGRTTSNQIGGLLATNISYDSQGRLATISQGSGIDQRLMTFSYNPQGLLQNAVDPENRVLSLTYDLAGRILTETRPDGKVIAYNYDANGNIASLAPPGRPAHAFGFSPVNLKSGYVSPSVAGGGTNQMTYAYNLDRQLDLITRADGGAIDYAYDSAGRLSTLTIPAGVYTSAYSPATSKLTSIAAPGGANLAFTYDGALLTGNAWSGSVMGGVTRTYDNSFRLTNLAVNGSGIAFVYDNDDLITQAGALTQTHHAQHGLLTGSTLDTITDSWSYNGFAEATSYSASAGGSPLYGTQYTRDKLGRITQKIETLGGVTDTYDYIYDLAGRLSQVKKNSVTTGSYTYDDNGNRLTGPGFSGASYDDQDRLLSHNGNISYSYSAEGELATKSVGVDATTFQYDALGNLRSANLPASTQIDYVIDGQNRRIGKRVNSVPTQGFLYEDQLRLVAEMDGSNNVISRFVYAGRVNVPDYMVKGGVTYRIITDDVGSVRLVVNAATGTVMQRLDYDEFGKVIQDTNAGFQPFGFAGGMYDTHTGLVRLGARDYDPATGRFTIKDFLRFAGRSSNLYEYAFGDPINHFDPDGLCPIGVKFQKTKYKKGFGFGIGIHVGPLHAGISFGAGTQSGSSSSTTVTPTGTITQSSTSSSTGIGAGVGVGVGSNNIGGNFGTGVSSTSSSISVSVSEGQQAGYNEQVQQWVQVEQQMLNQQ